MKRFLFVLASFLLVLAPAKSDDIDNIVKKAISEAVPQNAKPMPRAVIVETSDLDDVRPVKARKAVDCPCGPGCTCGPDCKCGSGGKCKPGCGCDACKKSGSEAPIERCWVIIDDVKIFTVENMTPTEAMSAIRTQGSKVVFIDRTNTVVDPPSWYTGKVALSHSMVQQRYSVAVAAPAYQAVPAYQAAPAYQTVPVYQGRTGGFQAGFGFSGPFGGGFQAGACVGGT